MIAVKAYSTVTVEFGQKKRLATIADTSAQVMSRAFVVFEYAPELADAVIAGGSLDQAYAVAQQRACGLDF